MKKRLLLPVLVALIVPSTMQSQLAIFGDAHIGASDAVHIAFPMTSFESGIVSVDRNGGTLSFDAAAQWENADNDSHIDGPVTAVGGSGFLFPIGHQGVFQPLAVSRLEGNEITAAYVNEAFANTTASGDLEQIHGQKYWQIRNASGAGRLTLTWNLQSNITALLNGKPLDRLAIAGYDGNHWKWIPSAPDDASVLNGAPSGLLAGSISADNNTPVDFQSFTAFTLAVRSPLSGTTGTIAIAEGLTPNNDGVNDTWVIKGIEAYPKAQVKVFNRLGEVVFQADNGYNNDWKGHFKNNSENLPAGPYFYTIDLEANGRIDAKGWIYINY